MADLWEFVNIEQDETVYSTGDRVPHIDFDVLLNGVRVSRVNVHMHRHKGRDQIADCSLGVTHVVFGPLATGGK